MSKKHLWERIDFVARNLVESLECTDAAVRVLEDRVAALEYRKTPEPIAGDDPGIASDLRTRIAALLELLRPVTPMEAADAVIRELGLRRDPIAPQVAALLFGDFRAERHRYVTEWTTDE